MAISKNDTILKYDLERNDGIVNYLVNNNISAVNYANGNGFKGSNANNPYYTFNNIGDLYRSAVYIDQSLFNKDFFCKLSTYNIEVNQILNNVNSNCLCANFNDLSTMIVNAFIPLANVRYSKFTIFEHKNNEYKNNDYFANAFLTNNAIMSRNINYIFANNSVTSSQIIINSRDDFVSYGNISNNLQNLKNNVVSDNYNANKDLKNIKTDIISNLISICLFGLNHIRTSLSCVFIDQNYYNNPVTIRYYKMPTKSESGDNINEITEDYYKYDNYTILDYQWEDNKPSFQGWNTIQNASNADFQPGEQILLSNSLYEFFPILYKKVTYLATESEVNLKDENAINGVNRPNYVKNRKCNSADKSVIEDVETNTKNFVLPNPSDYFTFDDQSKYEWLGWKNANNNQTTNNICDYSLAQLNTNLTIDNDYAFKPVFYKKVEISGDPPSFETKSVDIRITNNSQGATPAENQITNFNIKVPLDGKCSKIGSGNYSANPALNNIGFALKSGSNVNFLKSVTVNCKFVGNTSHAGYYRIYLGYNNIETLKVGKTWILEGESEDANDDFGIPGNMWGFKPGKYHEYNYTFTFDDSKTIDLQNVYIRFAGETGSSSVSYPYRFRILLTITDVQGGEINS